MDSSHEFRQVQPGLTHEQCLEMGEELRRHVHLSEACSPQDIETNIRNILWTLPGERPPYLYIPEDALPDYGCDLREFIFPNVDPFAETKIRDKVLSALTRFEPRITVNAVWEIVSQGVGNGGIVIAIDYTSREAGRRAQVVIPVCYRKEMPLDLP